MSQYDKFLDYVSDLHYVLRPHQLTWFWLISPRGHPIRFHVAWVFLEIPIWGFLCYGIAATLVLCPLVAFSFFTGTDTQPIWWTAWATVGFLMLRPAYLIYDAYFSAKHLPQLDDQTYDNGVEAAPHFQHGALQRDGAPRRKLSPKLVTTNGEQS